MDRRKFLASGAGTVVALAGGTAVANATRADLLVSGELTQGEGEPVTIERTITRDSVEYLESTNDVGESGHTRPFDEWARSESAEIGADAIVPIVGERIDTSVAGVGSGVRHLLFGPVVTVDHTVTRERDGSIRGEPNVTLDELVSVTPKTMTVTVVLDGHEHTREFPVGAGHGEVTMQ